MIRAMSVLGTLTGLGLFFGLFEDLSPLAFLVCWAIWLTFINSNSNVFGIPWDNLLLEAGLLAILLPGNIAANSLSLQSTPPVRPLSNSLFELSCHVWHGLE